MQYIASINSRKKLVHRANCPHARRIREENRLYFSSLDEARERGYVLCLDCCKINRYYRREKKQIMRYCLENGLSTQINRQDGSLNIVTPHSVWKIIVNGRRDSIFLYHENIYHFEDEKTMVPGYHPQKVRRNTILEYLQYIIEHDAYRLKNPIPVYAPKKNWRDRHFRKGSKQYKKQQERIRRIERRNEIRRVDELLDRIRGM